MLVGIFFFIISHAFCDRPSLESKLACHGTELHSGDGSLRRYFSRKIIITIVESLDAAESVFLHKENLQFGCPGNYWCTESATRLPSIYAQLQSRANCSKVYFVLCWICVRVNVRLLCLVKSHLMWGEWPGLRRKLLIRMLLHATCWIVGIYEAEDWCEICSSSWYILLYYNFVKAYLFICIDYWPRRMTWLLRLKLRKGSCKCSINISRKQHMFIHCNLLYWVYGTPVWHPMVYQSHPSVATHAPTRPDTWPVFCVIGGEALVINYGSVGTTIQQPWLNTATMANSTSHTDTNKLTYNWKIICGSYITFFDSKINFNNMNIFKWYVI